MRNKRDKTYKNNESGVAIPEFLISFPVLLILLFGSVDLGSLLQQYLLVQHAATIGAEKIQTLPSLDEILNCNDPSNMPITKSSNPALNRVIAKMNSVLEPTVNNLTTQYTFCRVTTSSPPRIQIQVSANYDKTKLLQMKGANLSARVEVPYFFGS